ncbi:MAG TPA: ABC transporter ATP-binding protein [Xanthobacteraceae bacterium]|jgi:iron complex transport system ATP-binding protein|nr:ABC transporter ATP-binding protein [Xanthobacteraceae bacterium]
MTESAALLQAKEVGVRIGSKPIVADAALTLRAGELVVLVGPNGAGKTTLLRALAGLALASGDIIVQGTPLHHLAPRARAKIIAYLPQGHVFHWPMEVSAVVGLGRQPYADAFSALSPEDRIAVARAMAATTTEPFVGRAVTSLSGGEQARVALARALATEAPILLADEPTASLDPRHQLMVMDILRATAHRGTGVLAILHDLVLASRYADRVLVMQHGRIVADDSPDAALSLDRLASVFGVEAVVADTGSECVPFICRPLPHA